MEQINQSSGVDPMIQGLSAFLFSILYQFNDDSEPIFSKKNLQSLVMSRIGPDVFLSRINRLKESKYFNTTYAEVYNVMYFLRSQHKILTDSKGIPEIYFDMLFVEFLKSQNDSLCKDILQQKSSNSAKKPALEGIASLFLI